MYKNILVPLDASDVDRVALAHVRKLAKLCGAELILMHVVDGWAGQHFGEQAVCPEATEDQRYLNERQEELAAEGFAVTTHLAYGDPAKKIIKYAAKCGCDLIVMSTHGHRWLGDMVLGKTAVKVQHQIDVPVLLLRARGSN